MSPRREPHLMTTTLWDFPSQQYGDERQGSKDYRGATPAWVIWNLLERFTEPGDLVVDPMCGSGTTLDVADDLGRRARGFDVNVTRPEVELADARQIPMPSASADFVFVDPPYSTHIDYSDDPRSIGKLDASKPEYLEAMGQVIGEIARILRPGRAMGLFCCDSFVKGRPLMPIGFDLFALLRRHLEPVDIIAVVRRNRTLLRAHWHEEALRGGHWLRGFNYLFVMRKPASGPPGPAARTPERAEARSARRPSPPRPRRRR